MKIEYSKPKRWDKSFASEIGSVMTDEMVENLLHSDLPDLLKNESMFPSTIPLRGVIQNDTRIREYKNGEVIVRKGDYGNSAFMILSGEVRILQKDLPDYALGFKQSSKLTVGQMIARVLKPKNKIPEYRSKRSLGGEKNNHMGFVHLEDYPEFLQENEGFFTMNKKPKMVSDEKPYQGHIFGELAALGRTARTVTVLAHSTPENPTRLLEIRWQGLRELRNFAPAWKKMIDERYRKFSLITHLQNAPYTNDLWAFQKIVNQKCEVLKKRYTQDSKARTWDIVEKKGIDPFTKVYEISLSEINDIISGLCYEQEQVKISGKKNSKILTFDLVEGFAKVIKQLLDPNSFVSQFLFKQYGRAFFNASKDRKTFLVFLRDLCKRAEENLDHPMELWNGEDTRWVVKNLLQENRIAPNFNEILSGAIFETHGSFDWYGSFKKMTDDLSSQERLFQEPIIVEERNYPDGLIMVRSGFARVTKHLQDGERTTSYVRKGSSFGLVEIFYNYLLSKGEVPDDLANRAGNQPLLMEYTLRAVGYTDTVLIPTPLVEKHILPVLCLERRSNIIQYITKVIEDKEAKQDPLFSLNKSAQKNNLLHHDVLEFLVDKRAINGTASMLIDLERCTRCDDCVQACANSHDGNPRFIREGFQQSGIQLTHACMHCADPVCMIGCPTGAIQRSEDAGAVAINDQTCIGCGTCANSCPYNNIQMVEIKDENGEVRLDNVFGDNSTPIMQATKCDLCQDELTGPACLNACPHDALTRINLNKPNDLFEWMNRSSSKLSSF